MSALSVNHTHDSKLNGYALSKSNTMVVYNMILLVGTIWPSQLWYTTTTLLELLVEATPSSELYDLVVFAHDEVDSLFWKLLCLKPHS